MQLKTTVLIIILLTGTVFATNALACDTEIILAEAELVTLDQAVNQVKRRQKGKVLGAETLQEDGAPVHVIKILTKKGHVKKIRVNTRRNN
ncbi:MAG: PepSY domain-containing protein [Cycloclasticus sp.]|nr:PepSY domain-containing protein [Cycloclasticus sp.]